MSVEANKAVARRFIEDVWNGGDLAVGEALLDPGLVNHAPDGTTTGAAPFLDFIRVTRAALPDIHFTIEDMVAEGDEVVTRVTIHATQAGASGVAQPMAWSGIGIIRIRDGRITEQWADTDSIGAALTALRQQPT